MQRRLPWVVMLILGLALAGCGQKGPLYIEDQAEPVGQGHHETAAAPAAIGTVAPDRDASAQHGAR